MNWSNTKSLWLLKRLLVFSNAALFLPCSPLIVSAQEIQTGTVENPCRTLDEMAELLNEVQAQSVSVSSDGTEMILEKDLNVKDVFVDNLGIYFSGQKDKAYSFDLNGHKITTEIARFLVLSAEEDFTFTIEDSKGNGSIESTEIYKEGEVPYALLQTGTGDDTGSATLNLKSGTFISNETVAFANDKSLLEIENAFLICRTSVSSITAVTLQLEGALKMHGGSVVNEVGYGISTTGNNTIVIEGGSVQSYIGINTNAPRLAQTSLTMTSGVIEGDLAGINGWQVEADISGNARISGSIGAFFSGSRENQNGSFVHISGGTITGQQAGIYYSLQSSSYNPDTDGSASISGGEIIATDENAPALQVSFASSDETEGSDSDSTASAFQVTGGNFSSKVDPEFIGKPNASDSDSILQVYNKANSQAPWQYFSDYSQALQALSLSPFNTLTIQEDLSSPETSLTLNADVPAGTGLVTGLYGENEYVVNLNQGSLIHLPKLQLSGYGFQGWIAEPDGTSLESLYSIPDQSEITLYGTWSADPDTPLSIPTSGKGIDEKGSQSVANVSGNSTTTYFMDLSGNKARSVAADSAPSQVVKTEITIPAVSSENSLQNPLSLSLGENNGNTLAIPGNKTIENAPQIMASIPFDQAAAFLSLPLAQNTGSLSTVAMIEINEKLTPLANTLVKNNQLVVEVSNDQTLYIVNNTKSFFDVSSLLPQYGQNAIAFMSSRGLMSGVGNGERFDPYGTLSRAQFVMILYRLAGEPWLDDFRLPADVPADLWYSKAAAWAYEAGLMAQGSNFNASKALSRQELAAILYRIQSDKSEVNTALLDGYGDGSSVSSWAREGIAWAIENQIIGQGSGLSPLSSANRMNSAAMFERYMENVYQGWMD